MSSHPNLFTQDGTDVLLDKVEAAQQMQTRPSGSAVFHSSPGADDDVTTVVGPAAGPAGVAQWVGDTTPPGVPTGITATSSGGVVVVAWDGTITGGVPEDFDHVTILTNGAAAGKLTRAGSVVVGGLSEGATVQVTATASDAARAQDGTPAPNTSAASTPVSVTVSGVGDLSVGGATYQGTDAPSDLTVNPNKYVWWKQYASSDFTQPVIAQWWWTGSGWQQFPVTIYLDQLISRDANMDSATIAALASQIVTSGQFRTSDTVGQATNGQGVIVSSDGVSGYGTDGTLKTRLGAADGGLLAQNAVLTNASIVGGAVTMVPTDPGAPTTLYSSGFETDASVQAWYQSSNQNPPQAVHSTAQHHSGTSSMLTTNGYLIADLSNIIPNSISPGCALSISGWVYVSNKDYFWISINSDNDFPMQTKTFQINTGTWVQFTADFEVAYGNAFGNYATLIIATGTAGTSIYVDDLTITRTPYGASGYFGLDNQSGEPRITFYDTNGYPSFQADRHQVGFYAAQPNETPASINSVYQTDTDSSGSQTARHTTQINSGLIDDGNMPTDENWIELTKWWYKTSAGAVTKWSTLELDSAEIILNGITWINGAPHVNYPTLSDLNSTGASGGKAAAILLRSASHGWTGPIYGHVVNDPTAANNGDYVLVGATWYMFSGNVAQFFTQNADWTRNSLSARISNGVVTLTARITRANPTWTAGAWGSAPFVTMPTWLGPTGGDQNFGSASANATQPWETMVQLNQDNIAVRPVMNQTFTAGSTWFACTLSWVASIFA